jgi:hypothetical protein
VCAVLLVASAWAPAARAQGDDPRAIAEALFRAGRDLMADGDLAAACPKFAESNRIDPKPGTLMNLALCHEKIGRTASAWSEYAQAAEVAHRAGQTERERVARERAASLEAALVHVVIDASAAPGAVVTLDDQPIGPGAFGTPIPVDPGDHVLRATDAGKQPFTKTITASPTADMVHVSVPVLSTEWVAKPVREPVPDHVAGGGLSSSQAWGFVSGGTGIVLLGIGGYFGLRAFAEKQTADSNCSATVCNRPGLEAIQSMKTAEAVATVSMLAGAAAVGAGLYLVLSSPRLTNRPTAGTASVRIGAEAGLRGVRVMLAF